MPRLLRRPQAAADILDIWDYIAEDSVAAADRWVDRLDQQLKLLATGIDVVRILHSARDIHDPTDLEA